MTESVKNHFDSIAPKYDLYKKRNRFYYSNLKNLLSKLIPKGKKVLEIGCGTGDLLVHSKPRYGVGIDLSSEMINMAKEKHSKDRGIRFSTEWPNGKFEYVFMSDVIEHLENPLLTLKKISRLMESGSVFVCTMANPAWEPILMLAEKLNLKMPEGKHTRWSFKEIKNFLSRAGMEVELHDFTLLIPVYVPILTPIANEFFLRYLKKYAFIEYFTTKKA